MLNKQDDAQLGRETKEEIAGQNDTRKHLEDEFVR